VRTNLAESAAAVAIILFGAIMAITGSTYPVGTISAMADLVTNSVQASITII